MLHSLISICHISFRDSGDTGSVQSDTTDEQDITNTNKHKNSSLSSPKLQQEEKPVPDIRLDTVAADAPEDCPVVDPQLSSYKEEAKKQLHLNPEGTISDLQTLARYINSDVSM